MESEEEHDNDNNCKIPITLKPEVDPLIYGVNLPEINEIADSRQQSRRQSRRQSKRLTSYFNIPSPEELQEDSFRSKCSRLIHSFQFQAVVIGFVVLDCIFIIAELIVDLRITKGEVCDRVTCAPIKKDHSLSLILQSLSLAILSLFMLELVFKLWAMGLNFFRSKLEIFDAIVVIVSWSLDIVFFHHDESDAISVLIFLRMWRVIRIVHAIAVSMITPVIHQLEHEEHAHHVTEIKLEKLNDYTKELVEEIEELRILLINCNRSLPKTKVRRTKANPRRR